MSYLMSSFRFRKGDEGARMREVTYDSLNRVALCSSSRFESDGILCRHVPVLLRSCHVNEMPNHYFLTRWAKKLDDESSCRWVGMPNIGKLWTIFTRYVTNATRSEVPFLFAIERQKI